MAAFTDLTDEQLKLVIKSLSITYDATSNRVDRLTGRKRIEALSEAELCDSIVTLAKAEQTARWRNHRPVMPIGTPPQ